MSPANSSSASTSTLTREPFVPYRPFPAIIEAYYIYDLSFATLKTFKLCDGTASSSSPNSKDALFSVQVHTGYIPRKPLGMKPGLILHNGPSHKDPILAAAGAESFWSAAWWAFNANSLVFLPPVHPTRDSTKDDMVVEAMVAENLDGDEGVAFRLSMVVGSPGEERIELFEWRKLKCPESKTIGFHLFSRTPRNGPETVEPRENEPLATITWPKATSYFKKAFTLELKGRVLDGSLGQRGTIMVVTTALRLRFLRGAGQMTKVYIGVASKSPRGGVCPA
ncbi:hypothetical protein QBC37DRAFT_372671 [Rhypophila decipiens]|uniref:Uncharacterized protein n=1 Tax=Rhypophila decipiens TaxID=261697 RepID=A0AAN7B8J8_9PEZI|nr:hypothetical protein QBC37DRAFT_372671 [Rhypophila decipiens]